MTTPAPADSQNDDTSADTSGDDGTDQDFPVETEEEKEEREAEETKEENDEVEKDYKNAFDQSEDFNPDQVDSEYGLDNYYQSGQNDFDNVYQQDIDNELAQLQMHGAVSIFQIPNSYSLFRSSNYWSRRPGRSTTSLNPKTKA